MKEKPKSKSKEKRRVGEIYFFTFICVILLAIIHYERRLFFISKQLAQHTDFIFTFSYFALINLNVIIILVLSFLIFRHVSKILFERRRGIIGSSLKTKLVLSFLFFSLAPTFLLFYITTQFVTKSIETWFSEKVKTALLSTKEVGYEIYKEDQARLGRWLLKIASGIQEKTFYHQEIDAYEHILTPKPQLISESSDQILILKSPLGFTLWKSQITKKEPMTNEFYEEYTQYFSTHPAERIYSRVSDLKGRDIAQVSYVVKSDKFDRVLGYLETEVHFPSGFMASLDRISNEFAELRPSAQLISMSFVTLMIVIVFIISFAALWLGFYVARKIAVPLQLLSQGLKEVALGNYKVDLELISDDEVGSLVKLFNNMSHQLDIKEKEILFAQNSLQKSVETIQRGKNYVEIILEHIAAGVISLDSNFCITSLNRSVEPLLGIKGKMCNGKTFQDAFTTTRSRLFAEAISDALTTKETFYVNVDFTESGEEQALVVIGSPLFTNEGDFQGYVIVLNDVYEQVRAQKAIAWREVAKRIAHEIKNPITPIKLNAQRMLRKFQNKFANDEQEIFMGGMNVIISQVDSLRDLVNEFSKFARLPQLTLTTNNLNEIITEVLDFYMISYPQVKFDYKHRQNLPLLKLDKDQLKRAFMNLVANSVSALVMDRPGEITVSTVLLSDKGIVRIEFMDNGCGIPKELKDRVLEPYFSTKEEGTGLGLAIVHQIVADHGGYLRIHDNTPYGTNVTIELPT